MTNRFATVALITLVSILGGIVLFVIGLFIMPGVRLFGIRYVSLGGRLTGTANEKGEPIAVSISDRLVKKYGQSNSTFSGIVVNCYEIPVEIAFTDDSSRAYMVQYYENFNGLTTSKDDPTFDVSKDDMGNAVITVTEFKTFIYESSTSERFIKVFIPLGDIADESKFKKDIIINSTRSEVSFTKKAGESRIPRFDLVEINSNGKINYGTKVEANSFTYKTNNSIVIDKDCVKTVDAKNYTLTSNRGSITVEKESVSTLNATTDQGTIKFRSATHFTARTNYGKISYAFHEGEETKDKGITISGKTDIVSKSGSVEIKLLGASNPASIVTTSGNIIIQKMYDGKLVTKRGLVDVGTARILEVESNTGKVFVKEVSSKIKVNTVRANIYLGQDKETKVIRNADIFTRIGKVQMYSANGSIKIETLSSDVNLKNTDSTSINIKCGGKLTATGLKGNVEIVSEKDVNLTFADLASGDVNISLGDKCLSAEIDATENLRASVNYYIESAMVYIYEEQDGNLNQLNHGNVMKNEINASKKLKVKGTKATVNVYFKDSTQIEEE